MTEVTGEPQVARWRAYAIVGTLIVALLAALWGVLLWLGSTIYSPQAFVAEYLDHVAADEITEAVAMPGVLPGASELAALNLPANTSTALLRPKLATSLPQDVRIVSDRVVGDGTHTISASYRLGNDIRTAEFHVKPAAPLYGVIPRWAFAQTPLARMLVTVEHDSIFSVGDLDLDLRASKPADEYSRFSQSAPYLAIAPAGYELRRSSELLSAQPVPALLEPSQPFAATVTAEPTAAFVARVQTQVGAFLDSCVKQQVLQPTGCPFGVTIDDRVVGAPEWTIATPPPVTLVADTSSFRMPPTAAVARVTVKVQSLFDGTTRVKHEEVPFTMWLTVRVRGDGSLSIALEGEPAKD
ncbi:MAG TPA: hypothetical protein VFU07_10695 [Candidatus Lumbricidophila sp.]|nr:hypothetical protein [Candidatus Lumbricidophila sp.]